MLRATGILLFAFIPVVLFLFLRQPLGPGWSVALGLAVMFGHRFVAAPWVAKFADVRCLWCGKVGPGRPLPVMAGGGVWRMTVCGEDHARSVTRFLAFVSRFKVPIGIGIFVPLAWLIVASFAAAAGHQVLPHVINALIFRVVVAATVVTTAVVPFVMSGERHAGNDSTTADGAPGAARLSCPFPVHNFALLGLGYTLWVFRLVGAWWLLDAAWRFIR
jgi:hypothetical protein